MFERNSGYVSDEVQTKMANLNVLFAGCGVGSAPAEAMARLGLKNYILVDGDTVEEHNLNRQSFNFSDIGKPKVDGVKRRLQEINPATNINAINDFINPKNVDEIVKRSDIIFDTIDFLDLDAIVSLHDSAMRFNKPIISLFTAGFGAVGIFVPPQKRDVSWIRELFQLGNADLKNESYTLHFFKFFERLSVHLNPTVQSVMADVFQKMKDGKPCPAPHVITGANCASAIATHFLVKYLANAPILSAPSFIYLDMERVENSLNFKID